MNVFDQTVLMQTRKRLKFFYVWYVFKVKAGMAIVSHRIENRNASHVFFGKISHLIIASKQAKNRIRYRIAEFDKKNLRFFRLF